MEPGDFEIALPHGYVLARNSPDIKLIADPSGAVVVRPSVRRYRVVGDLVVGEIGAYDSHPSDRMEIVGYFILDTRTGDIQRGMDEARWRAAMRDRGAPWHLELIEPSPPGSRTGQ
jgi:hypothetical protein